MAVATVTDLPECHSVLRNPSQDELRELALRMPGAQRTTDGSVDVQTRVVSRSKPSTYLVSDLPIAGHQTMSRADHLAVATRQDAFLRGADMVLIEGWIGDDAATRVPARLLVEAANANIAGMQQQLFFEPGELPAEAGTPLTVLYTPSLSAPSYPDDRVIAVDLEARVTRVLGSDYFGESKKGNLRIWNQLVHERGGLPLHAGAKIVPTTDGREFGLLVVGLSGTGKTTTTFTRQNGSLPVQDDFVAWWPDGSVSATEAGCFAKTFGLSAEDEPTIHGAVTRSDAWLENVAQRSDGSVDFHDTSHTKNGRAVFSFQRLEHAPASRLRADALLILNRSEGVVPAVAKLTPEQAAAFFVLGETTGTSAGGATEAGKFLRVPGTNPFFPMPHGLQGNRFLELLEQHPLDVYVLNTGRVGGKPEVEGSRKVEIRHSSAIVEAIAEGTIEWERDADFGYEVARSVPGLDDAVDGDVLRPRELFERLGRGAEHAEAVARLHDERRAFLAGFPELDARVRDAQV